MKNIAVKISLVILVLSLIVGIIGCDYNLSTAQQRENSINTRAQSFARAEALYPIPQTVNFPIRKALVKYTERQDIEGHLYYVYVLSDMGNIIGYYVSSTPPVSTNAFLSSTEDVYGSDSKVVLTAPSLDGIYYGGSGSSAGSGWFIFDANTDALIIIYGSNIFVADQPLNLEAKPITVKGK